MFSLHVQISVQRNYLKTEKKANVSELRKIYRNEGIMTHIQSTIANCGDFASINYY